MSDWEEEGTEACLTLTAESESVVCLSYSAVGTKTVLCCRLECPTILTIPCLVVDLSK